MNCRTLLLAIIAVLVFVPAHADTDDLSGGVLLVHAPPGLVYSSGMTTWCDSTKLEDCENQITSLDTDSTAVAIWFILSAWEEEKTFSAVEFGLGDFDPESFYLVEHGVCLENAMAIPHGDWPGPNTGIAIASTEDGWTGDLVPVAWFAGYNYAEADTIPITENPGAEHAGWLSGATSTMYDAECLGAMGLGVDGMACIPEGELDDTSPPPPAVQRHHCTFPAPLVTHTERGDRVAMDGGLNVGRPGDPSLPKVGVRLLLPPGEMLVSVRAIPGSKVTLPGRYSIVPTQRQYPIDCQDTVTWDQPRPEVYSSPNAFPGSVCDPPIVSPLWGYQIAVFTVTPFEYLPALGQLSYYPAMELELTTIPDPTITEQTEAMIRHDQIIRARVARSVDNPAAVTQYEHISRSHTRSEILNQVPAYNYLIVSGDAWVDSLPPLARFLTERGLRAAVFPKSWILSHYPSTIDPQHSIRLFIIDACQTWPAVDYVLLVGDGQDTQDGIPARLLTAPPTVDDLAIPADLYYACLDGTWNEDADAYWGEPGEEDLFFELGVGRACVDSYQELATLLQKDFLYQESPVTADCSKALMLGEFINDAVPEGGVYKDEIRYGCSLWGYSSAGFPVTMAVEALYDAFPTYFWSEYELYPLLNGGVNVVNHLGHSAIDHALKLDLSDFARLTNNGTNHGFYLVYSQGCFPGSFDGLDDYGSFVGDCFAEELTTDAHGAVAVVMNARFGELSYDDSTNGASQHFDRCFFDALFGEGIWTLGEALVDSKEDMAAYVADPYMRYVYYELNLFGDPALDVWSDTPGSMSCCVPAAIDTGEVAVPIRVRDANLDPVCGARGTLFSDEYDSYDSGLTDATGEVILYSTAEEDGTLFLTVTAHNQIKYAGEVSVVAGQAASCPSEERGRRGILSCEWLREGESLLLRYEEAGRGARASVRLFDVAGRVLGRAVGEREHDGICEVVLNCRAGGAPLCSGVYFVELDASTWRDVRRVVCCR